MGLFDDKKNNMGSPLGFSNGSNHSSSSVSRGSEKVDGEDVHYWYGYTQKLREGVKDLIEEKNELTRVALERRAINAGLRAVIRAMLAVLRKLQPDHPLLDKKNRDLLFTQFEKEEMDKILKSNDMKAWQPRERPHENQSE